MPTLELDGIGKVQVDESFRSLSAADQEKTVQEIVASIRPQTDNRPKGILANALEPITSYPATYNEMRHAGEARMSEGYTSAKEALIDEPASAEGAVKFATGIGKTALGALEYTASPINAAYRTVVGRPIEAVTGIPKEYSELTAQLLTPGMGFTRLPKAPPRPIPVPTAGEEVTAAGQRLGVDIPRAVTSDSATVQQVGKATSSIPFAGNPLRDASQAAVTDLGNAAQDVRAAYGSGNPASAGDAVRQGITQNVKSGPIKQRVNELYDRVDTLVNPTIIGELPNTRNLVNNIDARRVNAAMPESSATKELGEALGRNGMNYEGVKDLRTYFGEMRDGNVPIPQGMTDTEVKAIYGSLTQDMRLIIAKAGGSDGLKAFDQANKAAARWAGIREDLGGLLKVKSEEAIFDKIAAMAGSTARADLELLGRVRGAVGPKNWDEVASAVIDKMGWPPGGTGFSPDSFLTSYNKMSEDGRRLLFRSTGNASHANAIDDIATISQRFKELNKYANPSGTAQHAAFASLGAAVGSVVTGSLAGPLSAVGTVVGARILSHVLARPSTARSMAEWSKVYERAATNPTPANMDAFEGSSRIFAATIGKDFGRSDLVGEIMKKLQGTVPVPAQPQADQKE